MCSSTKQNFKKVRICDTIGCKFINMSDNQQDNTSSLDN